MNSKIALVFDMDGVIVDSNPVHTEAWRRYLAAHGLVIDRIDQRMHGKHNDAIVADFFGRPMEQSEIFRHGAEKEQLYRQLMRPQLDARLVPGIREFLGCHQSQKMAVASNAEAANVDFVLDGAGLRRYFQVVLDGHQVAHPKPDPEIYLLVAQQLEVPTADCIVFEDSASGVEAARRAGARVVGINPARASSLAVDIEVGNFLDPDLQRWLLEQEPR